MNIPTPATTILAQASERVSIWDNNILDEWRVPFGDWMLQAIRWVAVNLQVLLDIVAWPFEIMVRNLVRDFLIEISWVWIVLAMALVAWLTRNLKVAVFVAAALTLCGLLADAQWKETAATIGLIGVAVILCVAIGIPVGIACGRIDSVWQVTRPILDAMQVVHSFVYMLPFIWFFGLGEVSATMVTMVYALPPLIRLTNLGIRQVPADVVEASRAYGASETRVLFDVQIPLARPAIMTGINQTLLLAISMLGIAAIMGSFGLGRVLLRAINNQDVGEGAAGGLAFFLVAVVLDRMSQREGTDSTNLLRRIQLAWRHRRDPEMLIPDGEPSAIVKHQEVEVYAPITAGERLPMLLALVGGLATVVSVLLPWTSNAGKMSAWGRWADTSLNGELDGQVFNGIAASGGSWFGIALLALGLFVVISVLAFGARPGRAPRWLAADGAVIAAISSLVIASVYLLAQSVTDAGVAAGAVDPGEGVGGYVAVAGALLSTVGAVLWIRAADHAPLHPLPSGVAWERLVGLAIALLVLVVGSVSGWSWDERQEAILTPELQIQIAALEQRAGTASDEERAAIAAEMLSLRAQATQEVVITDGLTREGPRLGLWALVFGIAAVVTGIPAAGVFGGGQQRKWRWNAVTAGLGAGVAFIGFAWIFTHVRSGHVNYVSGVGAFLALVAGFLIVTSTMAVLKDFRRSKVYGDPLDSATEADTAAKATVGAPT
ncbi:MAG: ABC transporter permease subunit [bacterium]|nr:ABC transporter permease subunit [bacterium]